jgi:bifunctional enzyme CysN/CysC
MNDVRVVVAGHVDHGKSTIIGRLLYEAGSLPQRIVDRLQGAGGPHKATAFAFITDQLSEEQEGSFTLDMAQAQLRTGGKDYTLIDTPGHREFLRNMVTGTTRADAAILVVDAAEGPLPQTYLHAYLIAMLGIRQVIVVINKMDLVSYDRTRFHLLSRQLGTHLERIGIAPIAVIPASAQQGDHIVKRSERMSWSPTPPLVEALDRLVAPEKDGAQPLRFLVQCPFSVDGCRAILGKVASGTLQRGQSLVFGPHGHETVVASVAVGQQETHVATAGQSVGIFLQDAAPVERGHVGFDGDNAPVITRRLTARVFWISPRPLAVNDGIEILCGTQSRGAHVESVARVVDPVSLKVIETEATRLDDSQVAEVIIRTDSPICIDPFDAVPELGRFAILQNRRTAGGGVITK